MRNITKESLSYTFVNIIGSLLPLLALIALIFFNGFELPGLKDIIGNGELTIVCVSVAISTVYTLYTFKKEVGSSNQVDIVYWITIFFVVIGILIYASELQKVYLVNEKEKIEISIITNKDASRAANTSVQNGRKEIDGIINENNVETISKSKSRILTFSLIFLFWVIFAMYISKLFENRSISLTSSRRDDLSNLENKVS
ncbi:MAG: hypothetical protein RH981_18915 [Arenibacter sp.]